MFETLPEPTFIAVALLAVLITGISKSGLGGGLGQLSVPVMAMFISPVAAAAIMLPILCTIDLFNIWGYRKDFHKGNLIALLPGAVIGIGIGALTFRHVDENMIRLLLGGLSLIFSLTYFMQNSPVSADSRWGRWFGTFCGALAGFTSFVAHAGGGPVKIFLLPQRLDKKLFVGTQVFFFFAVNQVKIWPYLWLGQFSTENLTTSLILMPMVPVGVWLGWKLVRVIDGETFYRICYALLFFAGVKLIYDGLRGTGVI
ncbi:MAG: sulfite exporter TauE/SafE family protein [Rhodospirillales bacterium]|nr:sulfite exporter TauE/SafE family protein [Rhodospirillales bacterium]MBO6788514.1 sulfite exporter TauE/SafE family protein [Rhodospirillales bacterium]